MKYVCSQAIPGSGSSCKWESVGIEDGSMTVSVMTNVFKLGSFNEVFKMIKKVGGN